MNWTEPNIPEWEAWLREHEEVRARAETFPPWKLYRLKQTGQMVTLRSYCEDDTCTVTVRGYRDHQVPVEWGVFGIRYSDLEESDLPEWMRSEFKA